MSYKQRHGHFLGFADLLNEDRRRLIWKFQSIKAFAGLNFTGFPS